MKPHTIVLFIEPLCSASPKKKSDQDGSFRGPGRGPLRPKLGFPGKTIRDKRVPLGALKKTTGKVVFVLSNSGINCQDPGYYHQNYP